MVQVNYCLVKQNVGALIEDSPGDYDRYPDYKEVTGEVVFTPMIAAGQSFQLKSPDGEMYTVPITRIRGKIVQGKIWHEDEEGVPLFAGGENANPSKVSYRVTYANLRAGIEPVQLNPIAFTAIPGATIDLTTVTPITNAPVSGVIKGDKGDKGDPGVDGKDGEVTLKQLDESRWFKSVLSSSQKIDDLLPGIYPIPNSSTASGLGLPEASTGELVHFDLDGSRFHRRQYFQADPLGSPSTLYRRTCYLGNWREWEQQDGGSDESSYYRGPIPEGVTPEAMTGVEYQGVWTYTSSQAISWSVPSRAAGFLTVLATRTSTMHEVSTLTTPIQNYQRRWYNGTWSGDWERIGGTGTSTPAPEPIDTDEYAVTTSKLALNALVPESVDPTLSYETDHSALVAEMKSRVGVVNTGGKAAVALVVDHGTTAFKGWMWENLKAREIPCTMALAPEIHLDGKGDSRHSASNDDIKQWISEGLVIASHSGDHGGALGYFDISRQIVTSKAKLEEKLETVVDCWVQPGYSLSLGNYDGFGTGQSEERYRGYYAGRLLQQTYPVITGYSGSDFVYPGDNDLPVGVRRSLTERKESQSEVVSNIENAISTRGKHINFCHPYAIPDSSSTYVTKSEYIDYLDWLVDKRNAGDLVLLTLPQLMVSRL